MSLWENSEDLISFKERSDRPKLHILINKQKIFRFDTAVYFRTFFKKNETHRERDTPTSCCHMSFSNWWKQANYWWPY